MLSRDIFKVPKEARLPLILRGIFGFTSNIAGTIAMKLIPLAKATVLFYTNPIFIAILGWIILKEHITVFDMCGVAATFIGVVIFTTNPFASNDIVEKEMSSNEKLIDLIGSLIALFGATQNAGAMISIRKVGGRTHFMMLGLFWGLGNMLLSPLMMYMKPISSYDDSLTQDTQGTLTTVYGWQEIYYLAIICGALVSFQLFMTMAFIKEKAARVAPIGAFQLIINCGVDIFILNSDKPVQYNQVIGALIIFCSNITISMLKC